jgi:hypothetical protein
MTVTGISHKARNGAVRLRWSERSAATSDTHAQPSVNGDGAVWPPVEQEVSRLFQTTSSAKACRVGGLHRPFLLVPSLWASKEKELAGRQASESPPQASNLATQPIQKPMKGDARPAPHPNHLPGGEKEQEQRKPPQAGNLAEAKACRKPPITPKYCDSR